MKRQQDAKSAPRMISLSEWAINNSVSYMTAYRAVRAGQIPGAVKFRSQWRVPINAIEDCTTTQGDSEPSAKLLSPAEFAVRHNASITTVYRALADGLIPEAAKIGAQWRIPANAVLIAKSRHNDKNPSPPDSIASTDMPNTLLINGVIYLRADSVL